MAVTNSEIIMRTALEAASFKVTKIEEGKGKNGKRADYLVSDDGGTEYVVEVKEKLDNPGELKKYYQELDSRKIVERSIPIIFSKKIANVIRKGWKQIFNTPKCAPCFKIIWLHASGQDADVQMKQALATIYGSSYLCDLDRKDNRMLTCYYYNFNLFFKYPELNGIILANDTEGKLALNPFCKTTYDFKESKLVSMFEKAVINPLEEERDGNAYIADCDFNRKNKPKVLEYIKQKYKLKKLVEMPLTHYSGTMQVSI